MKLKTSLLVLFLFSCIYLSAQQANQNRQNSLSKQSASTTELKTDIQQLQRENKELKEQLNDLEKEIDLYRGDVRQKTMEMDNLSSAINDNISHWISLLGIIVSIVVIIPGIVFPIVQSNRLKEDFQKALNEQKDQVDAQIQSISAQAKKAEEAVKTAEELKTDITSIKETVAKESEAAQNAAKLSEDLNRQFTEIQKKITKESKSAEKAATQAEASRFFTEALSEEDPSKKIELYTKAIKLKPDYAIAYNNRGNSKDDLGDYQGAIKDYDIAIKLKPDYAIAYNNRGVAKKHLGNYQEAIKDYDEAIKLKADYEIAFNNRGLVKKEIGDYQEALKDLDRAIELKPDYVKAYKNRAKLYRTIAGFEKDENKKKVLLSNAETDEKKADSLK